MYLWILWELWRYFFSPIISLACFSPKPILFWWLPNGNSWIPSVLLHLLTGILPYESKVFFIYFNVCEHCCILILIYYYCPCCSWICQIFGQLVSFQVSNCVPWTFIYHVFSISLFSSSLRHMLCSTLDSSISPSFLSLYLQMII